MIEAKRAALLMIDMQNGFISPSSALCVAGAQATVPVCARVLHACRAMGMTVFHVRRSYAADGSNVEAVRHSTWLAGGRPLCAEGDDPSLLDPPDTLTAADGERVLVKPRFSAFFDTPLHRVLRREGVSTVVLIGTTTPNCIRSTCYDALSLGYNVVVVEDATSSRTPEVQHANIEDMAHIGAHIMNADTFCECGLQNVHDVEAEVAQAIKKAQGADTSATGAAREVRAAGAAAQAAAASATQGAEATAEAAAEAR